MLLYVHKTRLQGNSFIFFSNFFFFTLREVTAATDNGNYHCGVKGGCRCPFGRPFRDGGGNHDHGSGERLHPAVGRVAFTPR